MKFSVKPLAVVIAAAPFTHLYAQEEIVHGPIEIVAQKLEDPTPNFTEITQESIAGQRATTSDTARLLQDVPGVSIYGAGGISSLPAIHGMADDRVRVLVDGMGVMPSCPNHMNSPLSTIDPTDVSGIKIISGITPVSLGGDSIGGTVMVDSTEPEFATHEIGTLVKGQVGAFYRSNGRGVGGNLSATYANEWINLTYNGSTAQSRNTKAGEDFKPAGLAAADRGWLAGNEIGSSAFKARNNELGLAMRHDHHLVEFKASVQDIPYELFPNQRMDLVGNNNKQANLHYKGRFDWGDINARVFEQITHHQMQFGDDKQLHYGTALGMPMNSEGKTKGASVQAEIVASNRDTIKLGGELINYHLDDVWPASMATMGGMGPDNFINLNNAHRNRFGLFAEWDANWNANWFSQLGLRSERVSMNTGNVMGYNNMPMYGIDADAFNTQNHQRTDNNVDFTALVKYTPSDNQSIEFGYAQKTRSPNLYERYTWSAMMMTSAMNNFVGDGNGYVGNLNLKPEVAHTVSATWDTHDVTNKAWQFKATPYYTHVTNYIDAQRCPVTFSSNCSAQNITTTTGFVNLQYVNQTAHLFGLDLSGNMVLSKNLNATGVLNYARGRNQTTGDSLYNIMPLNTKLALVHNEGSWTNTAEVQLVAAKTHVSAVRNENQTSGSGLFNIRTAYKWKNIRIDLGIENFFNRFYNLPLGGAYVGQGKTMSTKSTPWGVPVPGVGRSINTAVTVSFN